MCYFVGVYQKDYQSAEENIKEALRITDSYFNDIHPRAARMYINLGRVYKEQVGMFSLQLARQWLKERLMFAYIGAIR